MPTREDAASRELARLLEGRLLRDLAGQAARHQQKLADALGLGPTDARCLDFVLADAATERVTAGYLAERMGLTTGAITGVLDRLEKAGFVSREKAPTDRRQVIVRPVPSGARKVEALSEGTHAAFARLCAARSPEALDAISSFLGDVSAMLEQETATLDHERAESQAPSTLSPEVLSAPLGRTKDAVLELTQGASRCVLGPCDDERALYRISLPGLRHAPELADGVLRIAKAHGSFFKRRGSDASIELSRRVAWELRVRGGLSGVRADLAAVDVRGIELKSGVSDAVFSLPQPRGTVLVRIASGVSELRLTRPVGVPVRFVIRGGVSGLAIDQLRIGAAGSELRWESPDYASAQDRYDIEIKGGGSDIKIDVA